MIRRATEPAPSAPDETPVVQKKIVSAVATAAGHMSFGQPGHKSNVAALVELSMVEAVKACKVAGATDPKFRDPMIIRQAIREARKIVLKSLDDMAKERIAAEQKKIADALAAAAPAE